MSKSVVKDRSIGLSDEHWRALRDLAERTDRSVSWHVRRAVDRYLPWGVAEATVPKADTNSTAPDRNTYEVRANTATISETRDPSDEEARWLREAYPNLKEPRVVDPNAGRKRS